MPPDRRRRGTPAVGGTLRARKRAETHVALVEAALDLFSQHGYEPTTMQDVAMAAGVAPRTAFRYFPAKDELVFADLEAEADRLIGAFHDVAPGVVLLEALRQANQVAAAAYLQREAFWERVWRVIASEDALSARAQRSETVRQVRLATAIGARLGIDPDEDPRPRVAAAAAVAAGDQATRRWYAQAKRHDLRREINAAFDQLEGIDAFLSTPLPSGE